jgi:hypothetical protein
LSAYVTGTTLHVDGGTLAAAGWMHWPDGFTNMIPPSIIDFLDAAHDAAHDAADTTDAQRAPDTTS